MSWSKTELDTAMQDEKVSFEEQNRIADIISADVADILSLIAAFDGPVRPMDNIRPKTIKDVAHITTQAAMRLRLLQQHFVDTETRGQFEEQIADLECEIRELELRIAELES